MSRESGFTLIEILIVLAILATLMGVVMVGIPYVTHKQKVTETSNLIAQIEAVLTLVEGPQNLGEFPPTSLHDLKIGRKSIGKQIAAQGDQNMGGETLALVIFMKDMDVGGRIETKYLINTDKDEASEQFTIHGKLDLFEIRDAWGHPLVYIHSRDYETAAGGVEYLLEDGRVVIVTPKKDPKTGAFYRLESYQIFSLGEDPEDPLDDIATFLD